MELTSVLTPAPFTLTLASFLRIPWYPRQTLTLLLFNLHSNPTDWKHIELWALPGFDTIVGCDVAGTVVDIGPGVSDKSRVKKGDLIAGLVHGSNPDPGQNHTGGFAEYVSVKVGLFAIVPPSMTASEAATLGMGICTSGWALFLDLGLNKPWESRHPQTGTPSTLLVYGASSACGIAALQLAKAAGWRVIVAASPSNHDMLRSYGADACFSYHDPVKDASTIREYTQNKLYYVVDTQGLTETARFCFDAMSSSPPPGQKLYYEGLELVDGVVNSDSIQVADPSCFHLIGETFQWPDEDTPSVPTPDKYEFAKQLWDFTERALAEGIITGLPIDERKGGLAAIREGGLADLRAGRVRGKKVVYPIA